MKKPWLRLSICGIPWEVRVAPRKDYSREKDLVYGLTKPHQRIIWLDEKLSEGATREILFHEIMHAVFSETHLDEMLGSWMSTKRRDWKDAEEHICTFYAHHLSDTLERNGMMKLPKRTKR